MEKTKEIIESLIDKNSEIPEYLKEGFNVKNFPEGEGVVTKQENIVLTEDEEKEVEELTDVQEEDVTMFDPTTGEAVATDTQELEENMVNNLEQLKEIAKTAQEGKTLNSDVKKTLIETGMSKSELRILDETIDALTEEEVKELTDEKIDSLLGKDYCKSISLMFKEQIALKPEREAREKEFKRDLIQYFKSSMIFEKNCVDTLDMINKHNVESNIDLININLESMIAGSINNIKIKLEDENLEEKERIFLEYQRREILDALNLLSAKIYLFNKGGHKPIQKDLKNYDNIFSNLVKTLDKSKFKFTDPREQKFINLPAIDGMIEGILKDEYKKYYKEVFLIIFRRYNSIKDVNNKALMLSLVIQSIIATYHGKFGAYQELFEKSINDIAEMFVALLEGADLDTLKSEVLK